MIYLKRIVLVLVWALGMLPLISEPSSADSISDTPILFVTMVPNPQDFGTLAATFGNHVATPAQAFRGGDLWIRYPDGTLKNITEAAGFGNTGFQGANAIAVRDPSVHWDGTKAIFSMVVGAATQQYQVGSFRWQLYEVTGLGAADTPVITKVVNQPDGYNNHSPIYASDDSIIFVSDRPRDDTVLHTYPQRDEYESSPVNTGIWKLVPNSGSLVLLDHAPSGDFNPIIDSFGRVILSRWDHLQRDQQNVGVSHGAFNFESEASTTSTGVAPEVFPEPRSAQDPSYVTTVNLFTINQFFPWMMNQDGTDLETLNHVGRQEIGLYSERSFNTDPNVQEFYGQYTTGVNQNEFTIFLHIKEKPDVPGTYVGTSCQEFGTHAGGQIITLTGAPGTNPNSMVVSYLTHPDTAGATDTPDGDHTGLYRDPLPLSNGKLVASHTTNTRQDSNIGSSTTPLSRYDYRLKLISSTGSYMAASTALTSGISKSVSFWSPDQMISYSGTLWEMMPVEVKARTRPSATTLEVPTIERAVIEEQGVELEALKEYLRANNLALVIGRNMTSRDKNDRQQPTNLRVIGGSAEAIPNAGTIYGISFLQFFQGDLIRGYSGSSNTGRRVLAQPMHAVAAGINPVIDAGAPQGSVRIASDGSMAAFVPARRALSWQLTDDEGTPVVRERYWITFQPGEIRVCASCHGVNTVDHLGNPPPTNSPLALAQLLSHWRDLPMPTPTPGGGGDDGDGDESGYSLLVTSNSSLKPGGRFGLTISGGSAAQSLQLRVSLNERRCAGKLALGKGGRTRTVRGRFPAVAGAAVGFSLHRRGSAAQLSQATRTLSGRRRTLSSKAMRAACSALMRTLR